MRRFVPALCVAAALCLSAAGLAAASGSSSRSEVKAIDHDVAAVTADYHGISSQVQIGDSRYHQITAAEKVACLTGQPAACSADLKIVLADERDLVSLAPVVTAATRAYKDARADASHATTRTPRKTLQRWLTKVNALLVEEKRVLHVTITAIEGVRG